MKESETPVGGILQGTANPNFNEFYEFLTNDDHTKDLVVKYSERYKIVETTIEAIPIANGEYFEDVVYEKSEVTKVFKTKKAAWDYFMSKQNTNLGDDLDSVYWNDEKVELWFGDNYGYQRVFWLYKWTDFDKDVELDEDKKGNSAYSNFVVKTVWDKKEK